MKQTDQRASAPCKYDRPDDFHPERGGYPWSADAQTLRWVPDGSTVLELGCATGYMGKYLSSQKRCRVTGIEQDAPSAEKAAPAYEKMITGDLDDPGLLERLTDRFDVILCLAVLEHMNDPVQVLKRLKKNLAPNGRFIIALPNIAHWSTRLQLFRGHFDYQETGILDNTHLRFFTYQTAQDFVREAGLRITGLAIDADRGIPGFQGLIRRIPKIGWPLLRTIYNLRPNLFAYQILIQAERS